jgi:hypothetical protein
MAFCLEGQRAGAFLRLLLMHFNSGVLTYFYSGVDRRLCVVD